MMSSGLLTLDRFVCMSKALCRYVALLRAVNGVKLNSILKEELHLLFTESGAAWADTYIASGNVIFERLPAKLPDLLRTAHANALAERLFGVPGTSRSWNTVEGLVRKFNASPTTKGSG
jgi:uncharacterized protein (DUF1697 family)